MAAILVFQNNETAATLVAAKQIVSQLIFSLSPFFVRDLEQNFISNLLQQLGCRATKLHVYKMADTVSWKEYMYTLNMLKTVAPILKGMI